MGNGALPNGPSYRAHPRLYRLRRADHGRTCPFIGVKRSRTGLAFLGQFSRVSGLALLGAARRSDPGCQCLTRSAVNALARLDRSSLARTNGPILACRSWAL